MPLSLSLLSLCCNRKTNTSHNATSAMPPHDYSCPFNNCVPWRSLVIDASNLTTPLSLETVGLELPSLQQGVMNCQQLNTSKVHSSPAYLLRLSSEDQGEVTWGGVS